MQIQHRAWGIGLGRTGTTSFCEALCVLGYQNVVHNPTFEELKDLDGAADNGCTIFYKYLDYKFPGSKFVLLTRELKPWLDSAEYIHGHKPVDRSEDLVIMRRMLLYGTVVFDREKFIETYHRHHEEVRNYFKDRPGDLLEMDITAGDGWEKLSPFLGLAVPDQPFSSRNQRNDGVTSGSGLVAKKIVQAKNKFFSR
ncbi:MAG: sulfotransferase family protein [Candidatus Electrothrix sp. GW3-4]|uniref:sulfotransferase family protein n=1 Tax=Candidatus Electrothrix sp. GW3-4 TaxID=3126740 RepID=UPI0030D4D642